MRFHLELRGFGRRIDIHAVKVQGDAVVYLQAAPGVVAHPEESAPPEPLMSISKEDAQSLMDELWRVGLRPSEGSGSAGSLAATERHLQDMRRLVFKESTNASSV